MYNNSKVMVIGSPDKWGFTINTQTQSSVMLTDDVWFTDVKQGYIDIGHIDWNPITNDCICAGNILVMSPTLTHSCHFRLVPPDVEC